MNPISRVQYSPQHSIWTDLQVVYAMFFANIKGTTHQDKLESFYKKQAHLYDSYRCRMLHGRKPMIDNVPISKGAVWVDLGGGTGSNLEFFGDNISQFSKVVVLDLTPSLVEVAKERVAKRGWSNVSVVLGDACDKEHPGLPAAGTCDVVTISYAITMIPDWRAALANAKRLLKPSGHLAICDFTVSPSQWSWMRWFWTSLFATDHVHLSPEHVVHLRKNFPQVFYKVGFGTFPYVPPVLKSAYHVYVGRNS
mmetsp:Transcript_21401/g.29725  ORF Transcript_21401/g.29725 Transcript_21401/m.29725 type:complete len:252 (-) Transcript_21401:175-930(-)|eukprot:CAMPEP_0196583260 /NCGR_PEP_ID=MMETSP1081-20130531/42726_1 /TAXON_ID=36882 /ORGANISM="Pyramimonas amylifera, Strain CCMP720" /LENGTH=251 /DNA_ID=CAMNT_0041904083 /DNA_START=145 /DNA_END=900 /DNA_ORIENTATION=+